MRSIVRLLAVVVLTAAFGGNAGRAALNQVVVREPAVELLMYEHRDCLYCQLFRRDVLPRYQQGVASELPIRFVDIAIAGNDGPGLVRKVDTLPTAVLMREGYEIDRIVGYWGPDNFFKLLAYIRTKAE